MSTGFGNNLRALRKGKGYTQDEVAKILCISRTAYTKYETGVSEPDYIVLKKLCELFEVDFNTLLDY